MQVNCPDSGTILEQFASVGDTVAVGSNLLKIKLGDNGGKQAPKKEEKVKETKAEKKAAPVEQAPKKVEEVPKKVEVKETAPKPVSKPEVKKQPVESKPAQEESVFVPGSRKETTVKMNRMRLRIAERLKEAQNTAASLTTFNEIEEKVQGCRVGETWHQTRIHGGIFKSFGSCFACSTSSERSNRK